MAWILEHKDGTILKAEFFPLTRNDIPKISSSIGWERNFSWKQYLSAGSPYKAFKLQDESGTIHGCIAYVKDYKNLFVEVALVEKSPMHRVKDDYVNIGKVLFAHAYKESFESDFDGYVVLTPKSKLITYYEEVYRATFIGKINNYSRYLLDPAIGKSLIMLYFR